MKLDDLSEKRLSRYPKLFKKEIGKELKRSLLMRKVYMNLPNKKVDELCELLRDPDVLNIINTKGDIDYPYDLAKKLVRKAPGLTKFLGPFLSAFIS